MYYISPLIPLWPELVVCSTNLAISTRERLFSTVQSVRRISIVVPKLVLVSKQFVNAWVDGVVGEWLIIVFFEAKVPVAANGNRPSRADGSAHTGPIAWVVVDHRMHLFVVNPDFVNVPKGSWIEGCKFSNFPPRNLRFNESEN